jgi:hypothetical protein
MLQKSIDPRLRRTNVVLNSIAGCVPNTSEELSRTPEMPFSKILPQPWMFLQKFIGGNSFKQLECFTNTHGGRHFNEKVDVVDTYMHFIDAESIFFSNFADKPFTVNPDTIELHRILGVLGFPDKVKGILPESMFEAFQVHFFTPPKKARNTLTQFGKFRLEKDDFDFYNSNQLLNSRTAIPLSAHRAEVSLP